MLNNNNFADGILNAFSWEKIVSKNPLMLSYVKEGVRLNYYFTTGTVTVQGRGSHPGECETYRDVFDEAKMEEIICKTN